ncbi:hypothetical protein GIB67_015576 [Kingdonia uniflora]|uniref:Protein kinase domain-containing protein n=1 Tax=Kingdonia uniflora TaxID=39325 RepID=A0A7J7LUA5_9MAGN|nr:hypothetical protein GIB67_015576 [Kingdonia uniflora]
MGGKYKLIIILCLISTTLLAFTICLIYYLYRRKPTKNEESKEMGLEGYNDSKENEDELEEEIEGLISFSGGENLTIHDILDAPGEVIGKSSYGTLYRARFEKTNAVALLRFLRPTCTGTRVKDIIDVIHSLGVIRHPNLVPLHAFYSGPRGEKLLVHSFISHGTLAMFLRGRHGESRKWNIMYRISLGIVKGLDHLHAGLQKPVIHGNLKSKNILLDGNYQPYVSDFGLHLLLNPTTSQEMLEASAAQGYKAPELIKMKDASKETDIYSLGVILLEILPGKEFIKEKASFNQDSHLPNPMKKTATDHRVSDMFQLAMACCSPSPFLRPDIKQVLKKLEQVGNENS